MTHKALAYSSRALTGNSCHDVANVVSHHIAFRLSHFEELYIIVNIYPPYSFEQYDHYTLS